MHVYNLKTHLLHLCLSLAGAQRCPSCYWKGLYMDEFLHVVYGKEVIIKCKAESV